LRLLRNICVGSEIKSQNYIDHWFRWKLLKIKSTIQLSSSFPFLSYPDTILILQTGISISFGEKTKVDHLFTKVVKSENANDTNKLYVYMCAVVCAYAITVSITLQFCITHLRGSSEDIM